MGFSPTIISMKRSMFLALAMALTFSGMTQQLKPYILAVESDRTVQEMAGVVSTNLKNAGLTVLGSYQPMGAKDRMVIIIGSPDLNRAVQQYGGLTGFALTLRVAITREGNKTLVSYTNPEYWGNAYFRDNFSKVSRWYNTLQGKLVTAMKASGDHLGKPFGSKEGVSIADLRKYRYMFGMPRFDDTELIKTFPSHQAAIDAVEKAFTRGVSNVKKVYSVDLQGQELRLYGVALSGDSGEAYFMGKIDIGQPKHTAFLPYEFLIMGKEVHMLHGRFRIALSFPDLTMGTFTKIMSTPGDIEDMIRSVVEN